MSVFPAVSLSRSLFPRHSPVGLRRKIQRYKSGFLKVAYLSRNKAVIVHVSPNSSFVIANYANALRGAWLAVVSYR